MNKRLLLTTATLLTVCTSLLAQKPLYTWPLGVEGYTYRNSWPKGVAPTLDTIRNLGFTELEGGARMDPREFRKMCDERGIRIPSIGADYNRLLQHPDSVILQAKILGAKYVMCAWIPHEDGVLTFQDAEKAVQDFNKIGRELAGQELVFCYHAHGYEFQPYENGTLLDYIITHTDPRYVSFEMDIMWISFGGGDPVALMKKYGSRWKLLHLKDLRKGAPTNLTGLTGPENDVPLGQGQENIPAILKEAKKIGIRHCFIEDESADPTVPVPESIAYLKSLKA
ncbi:MAG TPA: TIM barrel protein [Puia sp.]|nr:TIM barrel protein [Puia sp.]